MNFTVEWEPTAEDDLADAWAEAPDPAAVTRASAEIDRRLAADPVANGIHRSEGLWRISVSPIVAVYSVDLAGRRVEVTNVARLA